MLYAKIGIAIAVILAAYWKGYSDEHERFLKFQAEVAAIGKAQEIANQNAVMVAELISEGVRDEYEVKIAALRSKYAGAGRVQQCGSSGSKVPSVSKPSSSTNGAANDLGVIGNCALETAKLVALQKWITKQQELNNHGQ
jgi:hypothetical protein